MTGQSPGVVGESVVAAPVEGDAGLDGRSRSAGRDHGLAWATSQTLAESSAWVVALAGFLARGGIVILLVPILPLPSPVGIANIVGPAVVTPAGPSSQGIAILVAAGIVVVGWVVLGVLIGAATDGYLARAEPPWAAVGGTVAGEPGASAAGPRVVARLAAIRFALLMLLAVAVAVAAGPVVDSTYRELISPFDLETPLADRVAHETAPFLALVVAAWAVAEVAGGIAVRLAVQRDIGALGALGAMVRHVVRRPLGVLATTVVSFVVLALAVGPAIVVASAGFSLVEAGVGAGGDPRMALAGGILVLVSWLGGIVLAGVASTWRGLLWSAEVAHGPPAGRAQTGTFDRGGPDPSGGLVD
jgi:hypothetical protein